MCDIEISFSACTSLEAKCEHEVTYIHSYIYNT